MLDALFLSAREEGLRDVSRRTLHRLKHVTPLHTHRALGMVMNFAKIGPGTRDPSANRLLQYAGILQRHPTTWPDSPRLDPLPWGAGLIPSNAEIPKGLAGPWPQAPVVDDQLYAPVLNLDANEVRQHVRDNVLRYMGQAAVLVGPAALRAKRGPRLVALDDATFMRILVDTAFAQFICRRLDPVDLERFGRYIGSSPEEFVKVDASGLQSQETLPGMFCVQTVMLLRRITPGRLTPVAIALENRVVEPADGPAWELARYFVLQGLNYLLVIMFHPRLHFPNDIVNAVTRTLLPREHVLHKLLEPFLELTLGLHAAVIHHRRSVLHNSQREIYTPFPVTTEGIHASVAVGRNGLSGNSAFLPYRWGDAWMDPEFAYGRFRRDWHDATLAMTSDVLAHVPADDPLVLQWAEAIHAWLPSFPDADEIVRPGVLARAVTYFILAGSVFHTGDHHSYSSIPLERIPWRLRRGPLVAGESGPLELDALVTVEDFFRHQLCHAMFFAPAVLRSLREVRWRFNDSALQGAVRAFRKRMDELDRCWQGSNFPQSHQIASSAQY